MSKARGGGFVGLKAVISSRYSFFATRTFFAISDCVIVSFLLSDQASVCLLLKRWRCCADRLLICILSVIRQMRMLIIDVFFRHIWIKRRGFGHLRTTHHSGWSAWCLFGFKLYVFVKHARCMLRYSSNFSSCHGAKNYCKRCILYFSEY